MSRISRRIAALSVSFCIVVWSGCSAAKGPLSTGALQHDSPTSPPEAAALPAAQPVQEAALVASAEPSRIAKLAPEPYRIGPDDELEISVYGESDLSKTETVRPDGKIAFPLVGDIQAAGLTPDKLRQQMVERLSQYVKNPRVTVIISKYNSKKVSILGEVRAPGLLRLSSNTNLLEGISRTGGVTEDADLQGSMLVRDGQVMPVNFERLLRQGDLAQNVDLQANDVILVPNVAAKKIIVLGEVKRPVVIPLRHGGVTLVESLSLAGGFTRDAEPSTVLVLRGGLGHPTIQSIDLNQITKKGDVTQNAPLQAGDIVYVPRSFVADVDRFFEHIRNILQPVVLAETGIVLGPDVSSVLRTGKTLVDRNISISSP